MPKHPATPRAQRGFTLLELMVCVAILAIMATIVQLSAFDRSRQSVELASIQVCDALKRAQTLARSTREPHGVDFDLANDRFIVVDSDGDPALDPLTRQDYFVDFIRPNQPGGIDVQSADFGDAGTSALFDAQGVPLAGGMVTLACKNQSSTVTLDPATGKAARN